MAYYNFHKNYSAIRFGEFPPQRQPYLRPGAGGFAGYGTPAVAAVELGLAVYQPVKDLFTGGDFSTSSNVVNYMHPNTPLEQKFISPPCTQALLIRAYKPNPYIPLPLAKQRGIAERFWFRISYEYNGNDLRNVAVEPLVNQSSSLNKSKFKISFAGAPYSLERDPVAEIVYRISGTWLAWDPRPFMNTEVTFSGNLYIRANGSARVADFKSEKDIVWVSSLGPSPSYACLPRIPYMPKPRVVKPYLLTVLFPFAKDAVSETDARRTYDWVNSWPTTTRDKVARGEITVSIEGFASRPGKGLFNLKLSEGRAENVRKILQKFTGSNTKFDMRAHGNFSQTFLQQILRMFDPNKFDQAAVIRFEDVQ